MNKAVTWFKGTKKSTKAILTSIVVVGSFFTASSAMPSTAPPSTPQPAQAESPKEPVFTHKTETTTRPMPFPSVIQKDASLAKGSSYIKVAGKNGVITRTYDITLADGVETNRTVSEKVAVKPITQVTVVGTYVKPAPTPAVASVSSCDRNYSGCVPLVSYDLDCKDIRFEVRVLGNDVHGFDRDGDGYGCESYN